mmetsp:Transcript_4264/g.15719  ORF Transcript_4264/g.15719 Transcript_4264/m.15719 type:complete len:420 (+) Transcript_4264:786-2045(+)
MSSPWPWSGVMPRHLAARSSLQAANMAGLRWMSVARSASSACTAVRHAALMPPSAVAVSAELSSRHWKSWPSSTSAQYLLASATQLSAMAGSSSGCSASMTSSVCSSPRHAGDRSFLWRRRHWCRRPLPPLRPGHRRAMSAAHRSASCASSSMLSAMSLTIDRVIALQLRSVMSSMCVFRHERSEPWFSVLASSCISTSGPHSVSAVFRQARSRFGENRISCTRSWWKRASAAPHWTPISSFSAFSSKHVSTPPSPACSGTSAQSASMVGVQKSRTLGFNWMSSASSSSSANSAEMHACDTPLPSSVPAVRLPSSMCCRRQSCRLPSPALTSAQKRCTSRRHALLSGASAAASSACVSITRSTSLRHAACLTSRCLRFRQSMTTPAYSSGVPWLPAVVSSLISVEHSAVMSLSQFVIRR